MRPLVVCAVLAACGFEAPRQAPADPEVDAATSADPTPTPSIDAPAPPALTARQFIEDLVRLECVKAFACKPQYPASARRSFADAWGTDLNDCVVTDTNYLARDKIDSSIAAGRITFDPASAQACLADPGIPSSCATFFEYRYEWSAVCFVGLAGHVADGASCTTSWECGPTSDCHGGTCSH